MSATPIAAKPQKTKKEKDREKNPSQAHLNERLKTVVRRLPPNLPEEIFWQSVQAWVTEETTIWRTYYPGKLRKKLNKENIPSRAYIAFKDPEQLALFSREYDGHVFRDKTGAESQAVVEFAPFPKIPSEKRKLDNRSGTIEKDEDFISFIDSLKTSATAEPISLEALIASTRPASPPKTTPLLEALKAEKSANKDKEAILRNHAHYNQIMAPSRKEEKKKASAPPARSAEASASTLSNTQPGGKKSGKKGQPLPATPTSVPPGGVAASQNAKAVPGPQKGAANAPANQQAGGKHTKAPRPPRVPQQPKGGVPAAATPAPTVTAVVLPNPNANQPTSSSTPTPTTNAPPAGRRTRPVIGLGSRQFEAALSGVAGLAGAASRRREKEKEKEAAGGQATSSSISATTSKDVLNTPSSTLSASTPTTYARIDSSDTEKVEPLPPASPRRERHRRHGRGGGGGGGSGGAGGAGTSSSDAPPANTNAVKVPSILQRASEAPPPAVIQKDPSGQPTPAIVPAATVVSPSGASGTPTGGNPRGGGGGGGRRGRGGGRGRGGSGGTGGSSGPSRAGGSASHVV